MSDAIQGLKPELLWKYFAEISRIPRGSKNEKAVAEYVIDTAKKLGRSARQDKSGNVVVKKAASPGLSHISSIALQGHLDMVCEKNAGTVHDFKKDPIELVRKGNVMMANGTTLGADNGVAVATNLAIMEDTTLEHGPLEFLFTIDEETGLTGAKNLRGDFLDSKILLNLDSEEEGAIYVGCSGGRDTLGTFKGKFESAPRGTAALAIRVKGLRGGHSGLEIDKNRGNAIKILNRILIALQQYGARISSMNGGDKRNAIPRECEAIVFVPKAKLKSARHHIQEIAGVLKSEIESVEADFHVETDEIAGAVKSKVWERGLQGAVGKAITALPHGVLKMSPDISGLVETSTNIASITSSSKGIVIATSQRSSVMSELDEAVETVSTIFGLSGARAVASDGYPGWKPNLHSPILKVAQEVYKSLFGKQAEVKAIHAGLECGIIGEKYPGMDMISFGPTLEGVHSPDEKMYIDTVERFWNFLLALLKNAR